MEDNSLDDFVKNSVATNDIPTHPRLRKIKRPKVRIDNLPPAPEKVFVPAEEDRRLEDSPLDSFSNAGNQTEPGTELITSLEAQNLSNFQESDNPYVLEGLSPELNDEEDYDDDDGDDDGSGYQSKYASNKKLFLMALVCFFVGLFLGSALFSSKTEEKHGLENIVLNPDVPTGRPRCGLTDKSQACVFYLMNWYKQELTGRDFYKLVAQLTGRAESMIETENLRYATMKIKPGYFAQLNIPALK